MQGCTEMPGLSHKYDDVIRDARMLKEKLERYRKARALKLTSNQEGSHEKSNANQDAGIDAARDAGMLSKQQSADREAGTLVDKLERYGKARARELEEKERKRKGPDTLDSGVNLRPVP